MNLILKFDGEGGRTAFVARLREQQPALLSSLVPAKSVPHAVLHNVDASQELWVREAVRGLGRVFEDVQFETFNR
jgi:hypothetical protein